MRHFTLILTAAAVAALMAVGCQDKPEGGEGSVSLHSDAEMTLPASATDTTISFTASANWTAAVEGGGWLSVSPVSGEEGEIAATLSASANNEAEARTATVRITCGTDEATVTVTQNAADGENPEEPEQPTGKKPKSILLEFFHDGSFDYSFSWAFGYDEQGRLSSLQYSDDYPYTETYYLEYGQGEVIMTDMGKFTVDDEGKATVLDNMYGTIWNITYDQEGYLKDVNSGQFTYSWENRDLTSMTYNGETYLPVITEYENTGYLDFNLFLNYFFEDEDVVMGILNLLGLTGNRSAHIFLPSIGLYDGDRVVGDEDYESFMSKYEFSEEETQRTWTWTYIQYSSSIDDLTGDIEFDADGDMIQTRSSVPMTVTKYSRSATVKIKNPDNFHLNGDEKYYNRDDLEITLSEPVPAGEPRETEQSLTVTVSYD